MQATTSSISLANTHIDGDQATPHRVFPSPFFSAAMTESNAVSLQLHSLFPPPPFFLPFGDLGKDLVVLEQRHVMSYAPSPPLSRNDFGGPNFDADPSAPFSSPPLFFLKEVRAGALMIGVEFGPPPSFGFPSSFFFFLSAHHGAAVQGLQDLTQVAGHFPLFPPPPFPGSRTRVRFSHRREPHFFPLLLCRETTR